MEPTPRSRLENLTLRTLHVFVDLGIFAVSFVLAYEIRFDGDIPAHPYRQMILLLPYIALARLGVNGLFGVYRVVWRYVGLRESLRFVYAVLALSACLLALRILHPVYHHYSKLPISIIVLEGVFTAIGMVSSRFLRRIVYERRNSSSCSRRAMAPTLLAGAGQDGLAIAREALRRPDLGIKVVGFLDDDASKIGMELHGRRVFGKLDDLGLAVARTGARQVVITSSSIPPKSILRLMERARDVGVRVRIVPGLFEILGEMHSLSRHREVRIEDLLSRAPIEPSLSLADLSSIYGGKRILVTGAGGSIGSELCRQLMLLKPAELVLAERDESNLFAIDRQLRESAPAGTITPMLIDVSDDLAVHGLFRAVKPQVVFHAAAYKHVPVMELFPSAAVRNNVHTTRMLAQCADEYDVESFVLISTDKAVNPTSVMGATKRLAEIVVRECAAESETHYSCVRFGNVLGSRGSVVEIFREQIRAGGPVTITHPDMQRFFMTIPEAANLVLQAATLGEGGEVFLLDMGEPVCIHDLALQMIRLSGFTKGEIPIKFVGMRPGEKLVEELSYSHEMFEPTSLRKVMRCSPSVATSVDREIAHAVGLLSRFAEERNDAGVSLAIAELGFDLHGNQPQPRREGLRA